MYTYKSWHTCIAHVKAKTHLKLAIFALSSSVPVQSKRGGRWDSALRPVSASTTRSYKLYHSWCTCGSRTCVDNCACAYVAVLTFDPSPTYQHGREISKKALYKRTRLSRPEADYPDIWTTGRFECVYSREPLVGDVSQAQWLGPSGGGEERLTETTQCTQGPPWGFRCFRIWLYWANPDPLYASSGHPMAPERVCFGRKLWSTSSVSLWQICSSKIPQSHQGTRLASSRETL